MAETPIVRVEQGSLQGRLVASPSGKSFYSFQGIPYAKPPLGSLRFKAPQPPEPWTDVRDASAEGNVSAQIDPLVHKEFIGDENCLFLNVYTPNLDGEFLPVMIFIHGGGFRFGSGNSSLYGADYLVERDVVVVTINYRCGALGFLSLNTPEVPGNAGFKDIIQAIKWVKNNIHVFGGNSGNVTIFGESCGGVAVSLLTASPLAKNLFNKAIIQSGTALNSWAFQKNPLENARNLAKRLGCEAEGIDEILDYLCATSAKDIVEATEKMHTPDLFLEKGANIFAPVVEKEFPGVEAALTEAFIDLLTSGRVAEVPIMIGSTTLEFTTSDTSDDLQTFIPDALNIERNTTESVAIAEEIKKIYFKNGHIGVESLNEYFELLSDKLVNIDTHRYIQYLVKVSNKPIYYYKFDYVGELNLTKELAKGFGLKHAGHMDELGYLFKNILLKDAEPTAQDVKMRERILRLWTNFAKSGNPTPDENHYITVTWLPVTKDNLYYLKLSNELSLNTSPDKDRMDFWSALYEKYYKIWEHPKVNVDTVPTRGEIEDKVGNSAAVAEHNETVEPEKEETNEPSETTVTVIQETVETANDDNVEVKETRTTIIQEVIKKEDHDEVRTEVLVETGKPEPSNAAPDAKEEVHANEEETVEENGVNDQGKEVNGSDHTDVVRKPRPSNEIKMVQNSNGVPKDVIRANDPPEDDLPKNIGVNKFVNFFESLGGKK